MRPGPPRALGGGFGLTAYTRDDLAADLDRVGIRPPEADLEAIHRTALFLRSCAARLDAWSRAAAETRGADRGGRP